jgi:hypothetical protein
MTVMEQEPVAHANLAYIFSKLRIYVTDPNIALLNIKTVITDTNLLQEVRILESYWLDGRDSMPGKGKRFYWVWFF